MADIKFTGGPELDRALGKLPDEIGVRIERGAVRRAMKLVLETAKATAPDDSGAGRASLRLRSRHNKKKGFVTAGVDTGKGNLFKGERFYLGFVEYGTEDRWVKNYWGQRGRRGFVGRIKETRWLRNALDDNAPAVVSTFTRELRRALDEQAAGMLRKAKK